MFKVGDLNKTGLVMHKLNNVNIKQKSLEKTLNKTVEKKMESLVLGCFHSTGTEYTLQCIENILLNIMCYNTRQSWPT